MKNLKPALIVFLGLLANTTFGQKTFPHPDRDGEYFSFNVKNVSQIDNFTGVNLLLATEFTVQDALGNVKVTDGHALKTEVELHTVPSEPIIFYKEKKNGDLKYDRMRVRTKLFKKVIEDYHEAQIVSMDTLTPPDKLFPFEHTSNLTLNWIFQDSMQLPLLNDDELIENLGDEAFDQMDQDDNGNMYYHNYAQNKRYYYAWNADSSQIEPFLASDIARLSQEVLEYYQLPEIVWVTLWDGGPQFAFDFDRDRGHWQLRQARDLDGVLIKEEGFYVGYDKEGEKYYFNKSNIRIAQFRWVTEEVEKLIKSH